MSEISCSRCKHWQRFNHEYAKSGHCRANPPTQGGFPETLEDCWCAWFADKYVKPSTEPRADL